MPAPKARKNYALTSPTTQQSGKKKVVLARFIRNDRLADPLHRQAFCGLSASPGARAYCDQLRPATSATTPHCGSCPTGWSASCMAA
jgi:hypothetical protein